MNYNFNINTLIKRLLGAKLYDKSTMFLWLKSLLKPVDDLKSDFLIYKNSTDIELSYTNQTKQIERLLNDKFDPIQRRIYVKNNESNSEFIYLISEAQPPIYAYTYNEGTVGSYYYLQNENTTTLINIDFVIKIPSSLNGSIDQIKANINKLVYVNKKYEVQ